MFFPCCFNDIPSLLQVPDYHLFVKKPMDFLTIQRKCARLSYATPQEFIEDVALVFENAEAYNKVIFKMQKKLMK